MPLNRKQDNVILLYIDHFIHLVLISNAVQTATNINQKYGNVNIVYLFGSKRFAVKQCECLPRPLSYIIVFSQLPFSRLEQFRFVFTFIWHHHYTNNTNERVKYYIQWMQAAAFGIYISSEQFSFA